jgi:hypothetical protein
MAAVFAEMERSWVMPAQYRQDVGASIKKTSGILLNYKNLFRHD